jgi:16S rRNA processing protein RimM
MSPSRDEEIVWPEDAVEVGLIVDAWGIKGALKVLTFSSDPQALFSSRRWYLRPAEERPAAAPRIPALLRVTSAREHGDVIVATAQDIADRNAAEMLTGSRVFVSRASFPSVGKDEFYWVDLIGLEVVNRAGESLGKVADLMDSGAQTVLRAVTIADGAERPAVERLIPFVKAYVDDVDLGQRRILVDWGLDY